MVTEINGPDCCFNISILAIKEIGMVYSKISLDLVGYHAGLPEGDYMVEFYYFRVINGGKEHDQELV
jgi:hypothetical protein